jgi:hypothetical protein
VTATSTHRLTHSSAPRSARRPTVSAARAWRSLAAPPSRRPDAVAPPPPLAAPASPLATIAYTARSTRHSGTHQPVRCC